MSRNHQARRRRAYGRRQHELHERADRSWQATVSPDESADSFRGDGWDEPAEADPLGSLRDLLRPGLRWAQDRP